ncbi:MAG TPA: phage/plasmid primase, P4 family [Polyangiaceae bacterium]|jgi:P4 family phage/plasmid primase-like protien
MEPIVFHRGDQVELAERMLDVLRREGSPELVGDEASIWRYERSGIYQPIARETKSQIVQAFAGATVESDKKSLRLRASDVAGAISLAFDRVARPGFFADAAPGLAFANGFAVVTAEGVALVPHAPEHRARYGYPFDYPGNLPPAQYLRFLEALFRDDDDRHEKIACLQEHAGASLIGHAPVYQRALVLVGNGNEGKSTSTSIISRAFPPGSVEAIAPQEWGQEYRRAMLAGKLLNVVAELPESDIIASEAFKAIITGDPIVGRHIRQAPFTFRPRAGHAFAANRLPGTNDQTEGFWRRLVVLRFNRSFTNDPERDPHIADKIVAAELPRIVAFLLEGAVRLLREREYTLPASHRRELETWRRSADQVALFLADETEPVDTSVGTAASEAYRAYRQWTDRNGHRAVSSTKFGMRLRELGKPAEHCREGNVYPFGVKGLRRVVKGEPSRDSGGESDAWN